MEKEQSLFSLDKKKTFPTVFANNRQLDLILNPGRAKRGSTGYLKWYVVLYQVWKNDAYNIKYAKTIKNNRTFCNDYRFLWKLWVNESELAEAKCNGN